MFDKSKLLEPNVAVRVILWEHLQHLLNFCVVHKLINPAEIENVEGVKKYMTDNPVCFHVKIDGTFGTRHEDWYRFKSYYILDYDEVLLKNKEDSDEKYSISTKHISKDRFLYLKENVSVLNAIVHGMYYTNVKDDKLLTDEIKKLAKAVKEFETKTGLDIEVR